MRGVGFGGQVTQNNECMHPKTNTHNGCTSYLQSVSLNGPRQAAPTTTHPFTLITPRPHIQPRRAEAGGGTGALGIFELMNVKGRILLDLGTCQRSSVYHLVNCLP